MTKADDRWLTLVDDYQALPISETAKKHGVSVADLTVNMLRLGVRRTAVVPLGVQTTADLEVERPTAEPAAAKIAAKADKAAAKPSKADKADKAGKAAQSVKAAKAEKKAQAVAAAPEPAPGDTENYFVNGVECRPNTRDEAIAQHIGQLGKVSDPDFSKLAGVSVRVVAAFRHRHGVAAYQLPSVTKAQAEPDLFTEGDAEAELGAGASGRSKIDSYIDMVGKAPDSQIARLAGVGINAVSNYRRRRGIPAFDPSAAPPTGGAAETGAGTGRKPSKIDPYADLLGTAPDRTIAEKAGVSINAVSNYRRRRGIAPFAAEPEIEVEAPVVVEAPAKVEAPKVEAPAAVQAPVKAEAPPRKARSAAASVYTVHRRDGSIGYVVGESLLDAARQIDGLTDVLGLAYLGPVLA